MVLVWALGPYLPCRLRLVKATQCNLLRPTGKFRTRKVSNPKSQYFLEKSNCTFGRSERKEEEKGSTFFCQQRIFQMSKEPQRVPTVGNEHAPRGLSQAQAVVLI